MPQPSSSCLIDKMPIASPLKLSLISESPRLAEAVRRDVPESEVRSFSMDGMFTDESLLSPAGLRVVDAALASDAALIEWSLKRAPELNTICFHVRRTATVPAFMLLAEASDDRVAAIAAGADDAFALPLDAALLRARLMSYRRLVDAALESVRPGVQYAAAADRPLRHVDRFGPLSLDRTAQRFFIHDEEVEFTPREYALLAYLIGHGEALCTREDILAAVWGITFETGTNMVDVYMHFLRRKLERFGLSRMIETVRGRGYRLTL